jgi:tetratricopeptide (TPR) repeat protein
LVRSKKTFLTSTLLAGFLLISLTAVVQAQGGAQATAQPAWVEPARQGEQALREGRYSDAVAAFEKAAKLSPKVPEFHANLAFAYYFSGRPADAAREGREALRLNPRLARVRDILGASLAESGQCPQALSTLDNSYAHIADNHLKKIAGSDAVRCSMVLSQPDRAVNWVRLLQRDFPDDPQVLYLTTHVYSDLSTAASERLLNTAPGSLYAHLLNAEVLELQGKSSDAIEEYRKVLSLDPRHSGAHYEIGRLLLAGTEAGAREDARREFEEELKIDPGNASAEYELGQMAFEARQWPDAEKHFRRARQLEPQSPEVLVGLANSFIAQGRSAEALEPLQQAVKLQPADPQPHYLLSFVYRRLGRNEDAEHELALYQQAHDKVQQTQMKIRRGMSRSPVTEPPQGTPERPREP